VLKTVGELLNASLRPQDVLARYGGEEFLIFLPGAGADEADRIGIRLCQVLEDLNLSALAPDLTLTASAGVATFSADVLLEPAYAEVDYLLYEAKAAGRNQVWNRQGRIAPAQGGSGDAAGDPLSPQAWRYQSQSGIAHRP